ncbi:NAD(P)H-dependent oxidoreductase [Spiractinospora alimapuensis]|uniref:NAD(P)H-dependent oxidoreductase n=1 Tax=Spiractinospora alimapuensis TaxID=2820884 RepID=UPI001F3F7C40|nr:NAD(P)H-dependent oxidoreductase [Spiractinospora alimapuensis]QVQ53045.1 NAD(P)H-dependent oxidoreductase [Spiractinospora alimapuensis]
MRVHWIFAHPEPASLNGTLMRQGVDELRGQGHEVEVSDLYAMGWKAVLDADDMAPRTNDNARFLVGAAQEEAQAAGRLSADIRAEQEKIARADTLVLQFPLWWFGPPAILKGWFDRVLVQGFAFGLRGAEGQVRRYGDGGLAGKRGLVVTSVGARESAFGPRGIHGHVDEVLFPVLHGVMWYTGVAAVPPMVVYGADRATPADAVEYGQELRRRLRTLPHTPTLAYRHERGGEYDDDLVLRDHLSPGRLGLGAHTREDAETDAHGRAADPRHAGVGVGVLDG